MRELNATEMEFVSGAGDECSGGGSGNDLGGITDPVKEQQTSLARLSYQYSSSSAQMMRSPVCKA